MTRPNFRSKWKGVFVVVEFLKLCAVDEQDPVQRVGRTGVITTITEDLCNLQRENNLDGYVEGTDEGGTSQCRS